MKMLDAAVEASFVAVIVCASDAVLTRNVVAAFVVRAA